MGDLSKVLVSRDLRTLSKVRIGRGRETRRVQLFVPGKTRPSASNSVDLE